MDPRLAHLARRIRRRLLWHRRPLAALCAAVAVLAGFGAYKAARHVVPVVLAASDLRAGHVLAAADLETGLLPLDAVPGGAITDAGGVTGRRIALPMRRHEPLTDVRILDEPLVRALGDTLRAVPVRITDTGAAQLIRPGGFVDVFARSDAGTPLGAIATAARVLTIGDSDSAGALLVLAVDGATAARLTAAAVDSGLSVALRAPPP